MTPTERALIGQATEHEFVNVPCGIMDQFISANGRKDHALMLDCKDLSYKLIPMVDPAVSVLVIDSAVKHSLADGGYAARRKNCEDACVVLGVPSLREATLEMLEEKKSELGDLCYRRARHVIGENGKFYRWGNGKKKIAAVDNRHANIQQEQPRLFFANKRNVSNQQNRSDECHNGVRNDQKPHLL